MTPESITAAGREGLLLIGPGWLAGLGVIATMLLMGFLLKDIISHWMAALMLKMLKPFRIGDTISITGATGVVESMGPLATVLTTEDNTTVFLPNRKLLQTCIFNLSAKGSRRITIGFTIPLDEDIEAARDIIEEALSKDTRIFAVPYVEVPVVDYGADGIVLRAKFWTSSKECTPVRTDAMASIIGLFRAEGIRGRCIGDSIACDV
jgi:small-conductance mechanosensitive channel